MAGASEAMLRKECSTGYRSRALVELADQALQDAILREIEAFEEGARATDDRTIVVLKRAGERVP